MYTQCVFLCTKYSFHKYTKQNYYSAVAFEYFIFGSRREKKEMDNTNILKDSTEKQRLPKEPGILLSIKRKTTNEKTCYYIICIVRGLICM